MLILFHELLLSHEVSERYIHLYRVSHLKAKFLKLFLYLVKGFMVQFLSATVVNMETIPKRGQTDCLVSNDLARRREPFKR